LGIALRKQLLQRDRGFHELGDDDLAMITAHPKLRVSRRASNSLVPPVQSATVWAYDIHAAEVVA
jgi:hypothetical protein